MLLAAGVARVFHPGGALEDIAAVHPRRDARPPLAARSALTRPSNQSREQISPEERT